MPTEVNKNYLELRGKLISKGITLAEWAKRRSYPLNTVYNAANGKRRGKKARRILRQLISFANE